MRKMVKELMIGKFVEVHKDDKIYLNISKERRFGGN